MKICSKCKLELDIKEFGRRGFKKDGSDLLRSHCNKCRAEYDKKWSRDNKHRYVEDSEIQLKKKQYVIDHLKSNPCIDCGETDPIVLQFDHVRGIKHRAIAQLIARHAPLITIIEEIAKCDVRCANCHTRITAMRAGFWKTKY